MTRFSGVVGFGIAEEDPPNSGNSVDKAVEVEMRGDVVRSTRALEFEDQVNPSVSLSNSISVVANTYALDNYEAIRYVMWGGKRWTVTSVEVRRPRLILNIGGVYNGPTP